MPQAGPPPQVHLPPAPQPSPLEPQAVQASPPEPHSVVDVEVTQPVAVQQPLHVAGPHATQTPPTQVLPPLHATPPPQVHTPPVQPSATLPQATHDAPFVPQTLALGVEQLFPAQQPLGHEVASQMHDPLTQCCPDAHAGPFPHWQVPLGEHVSDVIVSHAVQVEPLLPHVLSLRATHWVPLQQPVGQEMPSHSQLPPTQRCPR
jgi:hypothetical protein